MQGNEQSKDRPDFSKMSTGDKLKWFIYYYKWPVLIGVIVVIAVIGTITSLAGRKETVLNVVAVNGEAMPTDSDFWDDFLIEHGFDPKKQEVAVNANLTYIGGEGVMDVYSVPSMATILNAGNADVFICDEACFEALGSLGAFTPMTDLFPGDEAEPYEDRFVYVGMDPDAEPYISETETAVDGKYARGIKLDPDSLVYDTGMYPDDAELIVVLPMSAKHALLGKEMIIDML